MPTGLSELGLAMGLFVVSHLTLSSAGLRRALVRRFGEWPFLGLYSLLSLGLFAWVLRAYGAAPDVELWVAPAAFRYFALGVMAPAFVLVVAGYTQSNPTAVILDRFSAIDGAATGITRITRHPVMWGVGLWAVAHTLAVGNAKALILFGGLGILAFAGAVNIDRRRRTGGESWRRLESETSNIPFLAIIQGRTEFDWSEIGWARLLGGVFLYAAVLFWHQVFFGVSPLAG
jgi:uncharacterized membrane protein